MPNCVVIAFFLLTDRLSFRVAVSADLLSLLEVHIIVARLRQAVKKKKRKEILIYLACG